MTCTSVGESSIMRINAIASSPDVRLDRTEQLVLGEWLGQIMLGANDATACPVKQPILGREHDHWYGSENLVVLDQRAGLIAVQSRHHDVNENDVRLMIGDFGQRIETVHRREDFAALFGQQRLRRTANRLAVIDDEHFEALENSALREHASGALFS